MTHDLKIDEKYYLDIIHNNKRFEIRFNDRNYQVGDYIELNCGDKPPIKGKITYITRYNQKEGWVVFGFNLT
jgi:hypothetical protein